MNALSLVTPSHTTTSSPINLLSHGRHISNLAKETFVDKVTWHPSSLSSTSP